MGKVSHHMKASRHALLLLVCFFFSNLARAGSLVHITKNICLLSAPDFLMHFAFQIR